MSGGDTTEKIRWYLNHWGPQMSKVKDNEEPPVRTIIKNYYMGYFPPADAARLADNYVATLVEKLKDTT